MEKVNDVEPYKVISSRFLGKSEFGELYTYELTFNQSIVHTGRWTGIEDGLNAYRKKELIDEENRTLQEANKIRGKYGMPLNELNLEVSDTTQAHSSNEAGNKKDWKEDLEKQAALFATGMMGIGEWSESWLYADKYLYHTIIKSVMHGASYLETNVIEPLIKENERLLESNKVLETEERRAWLYVQTTQDKEEENERLQKEVDRLKKENVHLKLESIPKDNGSSMKQ